MKTYYLDQGTPSGDWWKKSADISGIDFTKRPSYAYFMHKDGGCGGKIYMTSACGAACYTGNDIDAHVPIRFHATVIVVAKGAVFVPPQDWVGNPWSDAVGVTRKNRGTPAPGSGQPSGSSITLAGQGLRSVDRERGAVYDIRGRRIRAAQADRLRTEFR